MKQFNKKRFARPLLPLALLALIILFTQYNVLAQSESGNVCVRDYQGGANCTANDVRLERLDFVTVTTPCAGPGSTATVVFDALITAEGSPNRYDIGFFIATDGTSHDDTIDPSGTKLGALGGDNCYHDYLDGPQSATPALTRDEFVGIPGNDTAYDQDAGFTGWWNGNTDVDSCGDMQTNTGALTRLDQINIVCNDLDGDGAVDISVCAAWDNNTNTTCNDVTGAFPGTGSKCSCSTINLPFAPTAVTLDQASTSPSQSLLLPLLSLISILVVATMLFWRRYRLVKELAV